MDATSSSADPPFATRTPLHIAAVALVVRDLDRVTEFYCKVVGLTVLDRSKGRARLGAGGVPLLYLEHRADARPDDVSAAGLWHTAFLMPSRRDLANWLLHFQRTGVAMSRASDHLVNEAIYFDDPEGNGVECYVDRPQETWRVDGKWVDITSEPLDLDGLVRDADGAGYDCAPAALRIGHVNLRVGDLAAAEEFYSGAVGLAVTCRAREMAFMSSGGYHHHVAANIRFSSGAGLREDDRAGLAWFAFALNGATDVDSIASRVDSIASRLRAAGRPVEQTSDGIETRDPWGTRVRFLTQDAIAK